MGRLGYLTVGQHAVEWRAARGVSASGSTYAPTTRHGMWARELDVTHAAVAHASGGRTSETRIVPLMVGDPVRAKRISDILLAEYGVYVQPINYPTVPRGTERLRFTPSPVHDAAQIDRLVRAMDALWSRCALNRQVAVA